MMRKRGDICIGLLLLLFVLTTVISYFPLNVVVSQLIIYGLIAVVYVFAPKGKITNQWYVVITVICFALLLRIVIDLELYDMAQELYGSNLSLYFFVMNGIILPVLIITRIRFNAIPKSAVYIASVVVFFCLFFSLKEISSEQAVLSNDGRYSANESLGVIQYSQLSFTCSLIGLSLLYQGAKPRVYDVIYAIALILVGLISIVFAGTRSCLVSLAVILLFLFLANRPKKIFKSLIIASVFIVLLYIALLKTGLNDTFESLRLFRMFTEGARDVSSGRFDLYLSALSDIIQNPIFGKSAFFSFSDGRDDMTFIHNSVLEIARSIGLLGGIVFLFFNVYLLKKAFIILKNHRQFALFAFLYIQYFVFSLFSESIFRIALYWFSASMILCIIKNINNGTSSILTSLGNYSNIRSQR